MAFRLGRIMSESDGEISAAVYKPQNGDLDYCFYARTWSPGNIATRLCLISFALTFLVWAGIVVAAALFRSADWNNAIFFVSGLFSIPSAVIGGRKARFRRDVILYAVASASGVAILPIASFQFWQAGLLTLPALFSAFVVTTAIFNARQHCGFALPVGLPVMSSLNCVECGYWLPGLSERRCPECGTSFGRQDIQGNEA